jgi:hypothetical protein
METSSNLDGYLGGGWQKDKQTTKQLLNSSGVETPRHVLVTTDATPSRTTSRHQRLIDLRPERRRHATPDALLALRDLLAVDGLIAAMGMGRDSFHPRFLLNPEVCPLSCC